MGLFFAVVVHDFEVDAKNRPPLLEANFHLLVFRQIEVFVFQGTQGAKGTEFRHAPSVQHFNTVLVVESLNHGGWAGRAANHRAFQIIEAQVVSPQVAQKHLPHRRDTCGQGDFFGF